MIYYYRYLFVKMKVFNYSELHFDEVIFYKIHTLVTNPCSNFNRIGHVTCLIPCKDSRIVLNCF